MRLTRSTNPSSYLPESTPGLGSMSEFLMRKSREAIAERKSHPYPPPFDQFDPPIAEAVLARWPRLCEEMFEFLAAHHPQQLLRLLLSTKIPVADLTFAAEIAGQIKDSASVRPVLVALLRHPDPVVREGAIYGMATHIDESVKSELRRLVATDLSPAVRTTAADLLRP